MEESKGRNFGIVLCTLVFFYLLIKINFLVTNTFLPHTSWFNYEWFKEYLFSFGVILLWFIVSLKFVQWVALKRGSKFLKIIGLIFSILVFFGLAAKNDYLIIAVLLRYGFGHNFEWLIEYWLTLGAYLFWFGISLGFVYWTASKKLKNLKTVFIHFGITLGIFVLLNFLARFNFTFIYTFSWGNLQLIYKWLKEYIVFFLIVLFWSAVFSGILYFAASKRVKKNFWISLGLVNTVALLILGGLEDILYFLLWSRGLPSNNYDWSWMIWYKIFGTWRTPHQIILLASTIILLILMWIKISRMTKSKINDILKEIF